MISSYAKKIFNLLYVFSICYFLLACTQLQPLTGYDAVLSYYENGYNSDNWKTRLEAIKAVSSIKGERAENLIIKALNDSHNTVKIEALQAIYKRPIKRARSQIRTMALESNDDNVRWKALLALSRFRDPRDVQVYMYNSTHEDWLIREAAIIGFLSIDDYSTKYIHVDVIIKALDDPSVSVRLAALSHCNIKHTVLYNKLILMLQHTDNPTLLNAILKALQMYIIEQKDKDIIIKFLTHPNPTVRVTALQTLKGKR